MRRALEQQVFAIASVQLHLADMIIMNLDLAWNLQGFVVISWPGTA
jgi:hypothetical protein